MIFLAHAGHDHEMPAVSPIPTTTPPEPVLSDQPYPTTAPDPATTNILPPDILTGGGLLFGLVIFWALTTYVFKLKLATRLALTMVTLLVVGMLGYQSTPVTSIVALTVGIALALGMVLSQLSSKPANKPKT